jgi:predicted porin
MKKSLFAIAALSALAGAAQAQSSVTVYGILDVGYIGTNMRSANNTAVTNGAVTKTNTNAFGDSAQSTSRLGFRGREDLGGGMSAFFTLETQITPNASNVISTATTANRQTFVGLAQKGIGQFAIGTQYTTIFNAVAATDPGQLNNVMGNVINDKAVGATMSATRNSAASSSSTGLNSISPAAATQQFAGNQNNTAFTVRSNNMLSLKTESFAGLVGNAMYALSGSDTGQTAVTTGGYTGGTSVNSAWGLGVDYTWKKLLVTANYQNFTNKNPYTVATGTAYTVGAPTQNGFGGTSVPGVNSIDNQQYYAATYDFGILKAFVQFVDRKTTDANNAGNYVQRSAQQIGVRGNFTPKIQSWASAGTGKIDFGSSTAMGGQGTSTYTTGQGAGAKSANFNGYQLGTNYILSKRTNLYAIYGQQSTSNAVFGATGAQPTSYNDSNYAIGVRHTF